MINVFLSQPMNGFSEKEIREQRREYWAEVVDYISYFFDVPKEEVKLVDSILSQNDSVTNLLAKSIMLMNEADVVVFLPNWENSRGCKVEYHIAREYMDDLKLRGIYTLERLRRRKANEHREISG